MTTPAPAEAQPPASPDPHVSKIPPDDPRLRVRPARGRTLRQGPVIALALTLGALLVVALVVAMLPASKADTKKSEEPSGPPPLVVPDTIRNPPDHAAPRAPLPGDRLSVVPLPDGGLQGDAAAYGRAVPARSAHDPRADERLRARGAPILFESARGASPVAPAPARTNAPLLPSGEPRPAAAAGDGADPNLQLRKNAFLDPEGAPRASGVLRPQLQHPRSRFEVKAGAVIPAVLITAINSDLPGPVIGQVRENVYDTVTGNYLLIPQGARLLAQYDSMVAWGQERVLVCWNRLLFPNGDSLALECMPAADLAGAAGLTDEVDEHWARILKGAAVASLLAATTQGIAGNTQGFVPTVPQQWANGTAGEINQVGQQITRRNLNIQPTITVRPGFSVNVIVTRDLVLPQPYPLEPPPFTGSSSP